MLFVTPYTLTCVAQFDRCWNQTQTNRGGPASHRPRISGDVARTQFLRFRQAHPSDSFCGDVSFTKSHALRAVDYLRSGRSVLWIQTRRRSVWATSSLILPPAVTYTLSQATILRPPRTSRQVTLQREFTCVLSPCLLLDDAPVVPVRVMRRS